MSDNIKTASVEAHSNANAPAQPAPKSKLLPIRKSLNLPPEGANRGIFLDINTLPEDIGPDEKPRQLLKLDVQLEALDVHGKPFTVAKYYNLRARGLNTVNEDLHSFCGEYLVPEYEQEWDVGVLLNKPVVVNIHNRRQGTKWFTTIASFHPAEVLGETAQAQA